MTKLPGLDLTDHEFSVPLDHADPGGERITVYAREVADPDGQDKPFLLYLQGGPGSEAPRPSSTATPPWLERALQDFRVLMLDQRGTGRSAPVGLAPVSADRLAHFRADAIVRDAEHIRRELGVDRWSVLGQSFGGFCVTHYLSAAPDGLREALITGGLPAIGHSVDEAYAATYARMRERNTAYYERFPADRERVLALHERLDAEDVRLPGGDRLTSRRLRQLGQPLGFSSGPPQLHFLLELPPDSPAFLRDVENAVPYARNPLYGILQEACWADGRATRWAGERVLPPDFAERRELFFGEHLFPWMFEDYGALAPLRDAAEGIAQREWPRLYDEEVLRANDVPAAAIIYVDDPYVERRFSEETASLIRGLRPWVTNEFLHDGIRVEGRRILDHLLALARGRA